WQPTGLTINALILDVEVDPVTPSTVLAVASGVTAYGIYKSDDAGSTWSKTPATFLSLRDVAFDPVTPTTMYAASDDGVSKSVDGGETWSPSYTRRITVAVAVDP